MPCWASGVQLRKLRRFCTLLMQVVGILQHAGNAGNLSSLGSAKWVLWSSSETCTAIYATLGSAPCANGSCHDSLAWLKARRGQHRRQWRRAPPSPVLRGSCASRCGQWQWQGAPTQTIFLFLVTSHTFLRSLLPSRSAATVRRPLWCTNNPCSVLVAQQLALQGGVPPVRHHRHNGIRPGGHASPLAAQLTARPTRGTQQSLLSSATAQAPAGPAAARRR